ncbi:MAG: energy transducer TonB [Chlorobi bacterium]|nr:energy transducer TonB [Chlorobiota bacterium]
MKWIREHIYGILGTLIVHLVLAIMFMIFKISTFKPYFEEPVIITFEPEKSPVNPEKEKPAVLSDADLEAYIHNIAVNRAQSHKEEDFDINKYIDQVKNEMIAKGELGKDNFIDQWRKQQEAENKGLQTILPERQPPSDSTIITSEIMASKYSGPTRVEYYLKNRMATHMEIPVYKCEGSGTVVVKIEVNRQGSVTSAEPDKGKSSKNSCMLEAAKSAAFLSTFNKDPGAPLVVSGTITYYFVAQ